MALRELNETLEHKVTERTQALQDSIDQLKAAQQQLNSSWSKPKEWPHWVIWWPE
jgi:C4-dicarboxylate-specific signal transduction histidine kinase